MNIRIQLTLKTICRTRSNSNKWRCLRSSSTTSKGASIFWAGSRTVLLLTLRSLKSSNNLNLRTLSAYRYVRRCQATRMIKLTITWVKNWDMASSTDQWATTSECWLQMMKTCSSTSWSCSFKTSCSTFTRLRMGSKRTRWWRSPRALWAACSTWLWWTSTCPFLTASRRQQTSSTFTRPQSFRQATTSTSATRSTCSRLSWVFQRTLIAKSSSNRRK